MKNPKDEYIQFADSLDKNHTLQKENNNNNNNNKRKVTNNLRSNLICTVAHVQPIPKRKRKKKERRNYN